LRVDNFATVGGRNACDMPKFSKFSLEKNIRLACQCVKYSLPNLHKYSPSLNYADFDFDISHAFLLPLAKLSTLKISPVFWATL